MYRAALGDLLPDACNLCNRAEACASGPVRICPLCSLSWHDACAKSVLASDAAVELVTCAAASTGSLVAHGVGTETRCALCNAVVEEQADR